METQPGIHPDNTPNAPANDGGSHQLEEPKLNAESRAASRRARAEQAYLAAQVITTQHVRIAP